jgi:hypothetical protein
MMLESGLAAGVHTHRLTAALAGFSQKAATRLDLHIPRIETALGIGLDIVQGLPVDLTGLSIPDAMTPPAPTQLPGAVFAAQPTPEA